MRSKETAKSDTRTAASGAAYSAARQKLVTMIPLAVFALAALVVLLVSSVPGAAEKGGGALAYTLLFVGAWFVLTLKWQLQLAFAVRRFRAGGDLQKTRFERVLGVVMTVLAILLAAASFAVFMLTEKAAG